MNYLGELTRRRFLLFSAASVALAAESPARAESIDALLDDIPNVITKEGVQGLQIAVIRGGEVGAFASFGVMNAETEAPVTEDTLFEAASLTKPVFAYVVMKLIEEGMLALDTRLEEILDPPASGPPERTRELTPELVLSHRTGLPNWYRGKNKPSLRASQGRLFAYSGMAYVYLQHAIERLTDTPLETLLRERLFEPLSMTSARLTWRDDAEGRKAYGHTPNGKPVRYKMLEANAASSLVCNARDYARFASVIARPPAPSDVYLRPETIQRMLTPYVEAGPDVWWGLGWGIQIPPGEPRSYFHWGNNNNAYHSFVVVNPDTANGVAVMTNSGNGLRACADIVPRVVSGDHPALRWNRVVQH